MYPITQDQAEAVLGWFRDRGGMAVWPVIDLSRAGQRSFTPALTNGKPTTKPGWQYANEPEAVVTDPEQFDVIIPKEVKRFHVAVRRSSNGLSFKLTDASSDKVRKACAKAGEESWYEFDYNWQDAIIYVPGSKYTLAEWAKNTGKAAV